MKTLLRLSALLFISLPHPASGADPAPAEAPKVNYVFNAKVVRVIDAATVALDVDLGFHMWLHNQTFILQGITAPDIDGPDKAAALAAKTHVQELLHVNDEVTLQSVREKADKPGTYRAILWKEGENVNDQLGKVR